MSIYKTLLRHALLPFILLGLYVLICSLNLVNPYLVPRPAQLVDAFMELTGKGLLQQHIAQSLTRVSLGFGISLVLAFPLALLFYFYPTIAGYFSGTLHFLRATPPLALVPLLILWFGIGEASKLALIVLASFFPVFLNTLNGLQQVSPELLEMGDSLGLNSREKTLHILLPEALPSILTGARLAFGYSWRALIGAEMIAASSGLGYLILDAQELARTDRVFIGILSIGMLGLLLDSLSMFIFSRSFPWLSREGT